MLLLDGLEKEGGSRSHRAMSLSVADPSGAPASLLSTLKSFSTSNLRLGLLDKLPISIPTQRSSKKDGQDLSNLWLVAEMRIPDVLSPIWSLSISCDGT